MDGPVYTATSSEEETSASHLQFSDNLSGRSSLSGKFLSPAVLANGKQRRINLIVSISSEFKKLRMLIEFSLRHLTLVVSHCQGLITDEQTPRQNYVKILRGSHSSTILDFLK